MVQLEGVIILQLWDALKARDRRRRRETGRRTLLMYPTMGQSLMWAAVAHLCRVCP